jgi:hypothetical protein
MTRMTGSDGRSGRPGGGCGSFFVFCWLAAVPVLAGTAFHFSGTVPYTNVTSNP